MKKCYVFINRYLGDKQAGIQAAHAIARMMRNPDDDVLTWADEHETLVLLNGGDHNDLEELLKLDAMHEFREPGLNNAITAVAYVPSELGEQRIEMFKKLIKEGYPTNASRQDALFELIAKSHSFRG